MGVFAQLAISIKGFSYACSVNGALWHVCLNARHLPGEHFCGRIIANGNCSCGSGWTAKNKQMTKSLTCMLRVHWKQNNERGRGQENIVCGRTINQRRSHALEQAGSTFYWKGVQDFWFFQIHSHFGGGGGNIFSIQIWSKVEKVLCQTLLIM